MLTYDHINKENNKDLAIQVKEIYKNGNMTLYIIENKEN